MNRLLGLELLRGLAALVVLLEHVRYSVRDVCGSDVALPPLITRVEGYWGVDLFFVLSGYVIGLALDKPGTTARSFLLARLARVLPLYLIAATFSLIYETCHTGETTVAKLVTTYTLMPLAGDALDPAPVHPFGWTLCYEFLFYLTATGLFAALGGLRVVPALVGLFALAPLAFTVVGPVPGWDYPSFALSPLTAEFALGLVAYRLTDWLPKWCGWALAAVAAGGLVRGCLAEGNYGAQGELIVDPLRAWGRVARFGLPAFAGVLGVARLDRADVFRPIARLTTAAGAVSYSLYLAQPFAFLTTAVIANMSGTRDPWTLAALTVAVTILLSAAISRCVDHPLHALAKGWVKRLSAPRQPSSARSFWTFTSIRSRTLR